MNLYDYTGCFEKVAADMPALVGKSTLPGGYTTELPGKVINAYHANPKAVKGIKGSSLGAGLLAAGLLSRKAIKGSQQSARMSGLGMGVAGGALAGGAAGYMIGDQQKRRTKQASITTDFTGMYNEVVKEAAAGVIGKSSFKFLGSKFTTDAPGRMMRYAQSNPMSAMGRAAAAGAVGTWAMKK